MILRLIIFNQLNPQLSPLQQFNTADPPAFRRRVAPMGREMLRNMRNRVNEWAEIAAQDGEWELRERVGAFCLSF